MTGSFALPLLGRRTRGQGALRQALLASTQLPNGLVNIREKMVEGRIAKLMKERALLEQPFIKDSTKTVE
eukprot:855531-Pyramimonas_sp.AAC.1